VANRRAEGRKHSSLSGAESRGEKVCLGRSTRAARFNATLAGLSPLKLMGWSGVIVTYLTSRPLYKRRSYRYEWSLKHLKPVSDVCTHMSIICTRVCVCVYVCGTAG